MLRHHLACALANLYKTPFTTAANILTLALGLACFVLAYGTSAYWRSADAHHPAAERLMFISQNGGGSAEINPSSAPRLAADLSEDIPELEGVARLGFMPDWAVKADDAKAFLPVVLADPQIFSLLGFTFAEGDARAALRGENEVVITTTAARRLFGDEDALGRRLLINNEWDAVVSGVIEPMAGPSFLGHDHGLINFEVIGAYSRQEAFMRSLAADAEIVEDWNNLSAVTLLRRPPALTSEALDARLAAIAERRGAPDGTVLKAVPLREFYLMQAGKALFGLFGASAIVIAPLLGGVILLVACANYANLAAAQSRQRAKTTGMRKVLGATRRQIMAQQAVETALATGAALGLALAVIALASPVMEARLGIAPLRFLSGGAQGWLVLGAVAAAASLFASLYPALVTGQARTVDALRQGRRGGGFKLVARILIGIQFFSASFLILFVTVVHSQHEHLRALAFKPNADPVLILNELGEAGVPFEALAAELQTLPEVRAVTFTNTPPWGSFSSRYTVTRAGQDGTPVSDTWVRSTGFDYPATFNLDVLAGRGFERERDTPTRGAFEATPDAPVAVLADLRLVERLGFETPEAAVGALIQAPGGVRDGGEVIPPRGAGRIVGVLEAEFSSTNQGDGGSLYQLAPAGSDHRRYPAVRLARGDAAAGVEKVTAVWDRLAPNVPANFAFADEMFAERTRSLSAMSNIFASLSAVALAISTAGLLGMAVHVLGRRRHEIGVRKVLGAGVPRILAMLLVDFSVPVLAANLLAWPVGYLAIQTVLRSFAERAPLGPAPFMLSFAFTLAIAWVAVIAVALRAANIRPAEVLRHA